MAEEIVNIREYLEQFRIEWTERMGGWETPSQET